MHWNLLPCFPAALTCENIPNRTERTAWGTKEEYFKVSNPGGKFCSWKASNAPLPFDRKTRGVILVPINVPLVVRSFPICNRESRGHSCWDDHRRSYRQVPVRISCWEVSCFLLILQCCRGRVDWPWSFLSRISYHFQRFRISTPRRNFPFLLAPLWWTICPWNEWEFYLPKGCYRTCSSCWCTSS